MKRLRTALAGVLLGLAVAGCNTTPADGVFVRNDDTVTYLVNWRMPNDAAEGSATLLRQLRVDPGQTGLVTSVTGSPNVYLELVAGNPCTLLDVTYVQGSPWLVSITGGSFGTPSGVVPTSADSLPSSDECIP